MVVETSRPERSSTAATGLERARDFNAQGYGTTKRRGRGTGNASISINALRAAKRLVEDVGGVEQAKDALDVLARLG